jgi:WD40 repeat protein
MNARRKLRKSEWVILLAPLLAFAAVGGGPLFQRYWHRYFPAQLKGHLPSVEAIEFSDDGKTLIVASWDSSKSPDVREMRLWNLQTQTTEWKANQPVWTNWPQFSDDSKSVGWVISSLKLMPDAEGGFADSICEIYDVNSGTRLHQIPLSYMGMHFRFLPDNQHVLCDGTKVRLWDLKTGKLVRTLARDAWPSFFSGLAVDKSGRYAAIVAQGKRRPPAKWTRKGDPPLFRNGKLRIYEIATGKLLAQTREVLPEETDRVRFSNDGKEVNVVVRSGEKPGAILKWRWQSESNFKKIHTIDGWSVRTSPDGKTRISVVLTWQGKPYESTFVGSIIKSEDTQTQRHLWSQKVKASIRLILFFPDSRHFAVHESANDSGEGWVIVRETQSGKEVKRFESGYAFMPSPDGKTLATSARGTVKLWDVSDLSR